MTDIVAGSGGQPARPEHKPSDIERLLSRRTLLATAAGAAAIGTGMASASAASSKDQLTHPQKDTAMTTNAARFTPANSAILLVDHQPGVLAMVGSLPAQVVTKNTAMLAHLGDQLGLPLIITSTRENLEFLGTTLKEVQTAAPKAYAQRIRRAGSLNAFSEATFVEAVKATKRPNLIIAGILTDVCLAHTVISALEAGYNVQIPADACGTTTTLGDAVTYDRLRSLGAVVSTSYGVLFDLYPDLSTADGQKAEGVAAAYAKG